MALHKQMPAVAGWLGALGLLPFVAGAAMAIWPPVQAPFDPLPAFIAYGAVILSFLGGARWALAMTRQRSEFGSYVLSVIPALVGVAALLLPLAYGALALAAAFAVLGLYDVATARLAGAPLWYPRLRSRLTSVVVLAHLPVLWRLFVLTSG